MLSVNALIAKADNDACGLTALYKSTGSVLPDL
jgi:hypothetical protein